MCHNKYQEWLMRKRNRKNSVRSDCLGGESVGVLIRKSSQNDDQSGNNFLIFCNTCVNIVIAFDGVAAASVPRDWNWSTF
jgi:hypothetical protein